MKTTKNIYPEYTGDFADFLGGTEEERQAEINRLKDLIEINEDKSPSEDQREIEFEIEELEALEPIKGE